MAQESSAKALADAVCEALKFGGLDALGNPQGLYSMLTDLADQTSPEMRALRGVLQESQDKRFLEPLAGLNGSSSARDVEVARLRMMHWLTDERLLAEGVSASCAQGLAEGVARYLGIKLPVAEPASKAQPTPKDKPAKKVKPAKKTEPAKKAEPAPKATPTPTPKPQPQPTPASTPKSSPAAGKKGISENAAHAVAALMFFGWFVAILWADGHGVLDGFDARGIPRWIPALGLILVEVGLLYLIDGSHQAAGCLAGSFGVLLVWTLIAVACFGLFERMGWSMTLAVPVGVFVAPLALVFLVAAILPKK